MKQGIVIVTGSLGLIGFETTCLFLKKGFFVVGIDNDLRSKIFHIETVYDKKLDYLSKYYATQYIHRRIDIRNKSLLTKLFREHSERVVLTVHTAAQTSHDWAKINPYLDFKVNALATLSLLELQRNFCPRSTFILTSTNKVYGDLVNSLPFQETKDRYDLPKQSKYYKGIDETFSIDQSTHSLFGVSKTSADLLVQEYGRYFKINTAVFRLGVVAGEGQNGALQQGFLSYIIKEAKAGRKINIFGYSGKQVRDIIDAKDVSQAFYAFYRTPRSGAVFNLGGGRENSISINELLDTVSKKLTKKLNIEFFPIPRMGDHKWWITNTDRFRSHYPRWHITHTTDEIIESILRVNI